MSGRGDRGLCINAGVGCGWVGNGNICYQKNPATAPACELEVDVDYAGTDLFNEKAATGSYKSCISGCVANAACTHFTFLVNPNRGPWCYYKTSGGGAKALEGAVSGACPKV